VEAGVCEELTDLKKAMRDYAVGFDANCLTTSSAQRAIATLGAIESIAQNLKALAAARVADTGGWRRNGHSSAAEELAKTTGTSVSSAREAIETGKRLLCQKSLQEKARRGDLSFAQASLISNAVEEDPGSESQLVSCARTSSHTELKDEVARTKQRARDQEETRRHIHRRRSLRQWTDIEGTWHLHASSNPEDGARIMAAVSSISEGLFEEARKEGRREPTCAYDFDALLELARSFFDDPRGTGKAEKDEQGHGRRRRQPGTTPTKLLVRVDYDAFLRGVADEGETSEIVGFGPVAVSAIRDLLETEDPFVAAILTRAKALVGVAHLGRRPNAHQKSALEWLYPSCSVEGCPRQAHLEVDHTVDWAKTHYTMLDFLDRKCSHHHDLKTREGWDLIDGTGKRPMVPPDDPRHPRHKKKPAA
jgi:hypothetical protein